MSSRTTKSKIDINLFVEYLENLKQFNLTFTSQNDYLNLR